MPYCQQPRTPFWLPHDQLPVPWHVLNLCGYGHATNSSCGSGFAEGTATRRTHRAPFEDVTPISPNLHCKLLLVVLQLNKSITAVVDSATNNLKRMALTFLMISSSLM